MNLADYYQAYKDYFWVWEEDGEVIAVSGGSTIGFRQQISEILGGIAENGLPPFGAFVLLMIGTNKTMDDSIGQVQTVLSNQLEAKGLGHTSSQEMFTDAFDFLRMLANIPEEFKIGKRRQILLQTIFTNSHNRFNIPTSRGLAIGLKNNTKAGRFLHQKEIPNNILWKEIRVVTLLKKRFPTVQSLIDAMGELPDLEEHELPLLENISVKETNYEDFVEELMDNPRTFEAAALIKPIWAGFHIPIFNAHPSDQPLGGVSDLSNKGDFDKLLISEFANDDLVFMNRVANNEALYLHREMPPVKDKLHRTILLDISLKSWGTPKILSFATYIAIARHPKAITQTGAFTVGENYLPVSCSSSTEIIDAIQQTDPSLHPGKGLAAFLEDNKQDKDLEIFYLTTAEALKYPQVQKQLAAYQPFFKYIISTDASGAIHFYRNKKSGMHHLQSIQLPLEKLWTQKRTRRQPPPVQTPLNEDSIPMLLPVIADIRKQILPLDDDNTYCITNRTLLKHVVERASKKVRALELVLRNIPADSIYEIGRIEEGDILFMYFHPKRRTLCITNLATCKSAKIIFDQWDPKLFQEFLFYESRLFVYSKGTGSALQLFPDFELGVITFEETKLPMDVLAVGVRRKHQREVMDRTADYLPANVLKNVTQVYINRNNYLVINAHQFHASNNGKLFFTSGDGVQKISSERVGNKRDFVFKDGSRVLIDPLGYIELRSINPEIPPVFISSTPDAVPAMATSKQFAGNEIYLNENIGKVTVRINSRGRNIMLGIQIVRRYTNMGLAEIKGLLELVPGKIPVKLHLEAAEEMLEKLSVEGFTAVIEKSGEPRQHIISAEQFYLENIATFIGHIINHEPAG